MSAPELKPCPFCGGDLINPYLKNPEVFKHLPHETCYARQVIVHPENYTDWNTRADLAAAQIEDARRDAWAEAMKAAKDNVSARCVGVCDFPDACRCELADRIFPIPYPGDAT
jgi:hypothetical protein